MAANITVPPTGGAGTANPVVATDDVSAVQYQKVKLDGGGTGLTVPIVAGQKTMANSLPVTLASDQDQPLYIGRAFSFRMPGRAGTTGQKIMALHNATGSAVTAYVTGVWVDHTATVVIAVTVLPPIVRVWKVTVVPTNGTAMTKVQIGGSSTANASVTVWQDASADGTSSTSALTATLPAGTILAQEFAPRLITAAGYEMEDRFDFEFPRPIKCAALEGVVVFLDYTAAGQNAVTDMWAAGIEWYEK